MADKQRRRRDEGLAEAPSALADALGSHAATAGAQRQQALARAASLLKMKAKMTSARGGGLSFGGPAGAAPPPAAAASADLPPPAPRHTAAQGSVPGAAEVQQSVRGGSTHVQSQRTGARTASHPPQQQPAVSTHSSADGADHAADGQTSGQASGHAGGALAALPTAAAQQHWAGTADPGSYFAQARSFLQQLAASRNGLG